MRALGMLPDTRSSTRKKIPEPFVARSSSWLRAPESGMFKSTVKLGAQVGKDDIVGYIAESSTGVRHRYFKERRRDHRTTGIATGA